MIRSVILAALLGSTLLANVDKCDKKCKDNCVSKKDFSDKCMRHCGCTSYKAAMMEFLESKEAGHEFCASYCDDTSKDMHNECQSDCEEEFGGHATHMKPMKPKVIYNKKIDKTSTGLADQRSDLISSLTQGVQGMATDLPGDFGNLVSRVVTNIRYGIQQTDMNGVDGLLNDWQLPQEVHNFLSNIMYSDSVMYQTYHFAVW